MCCNGSLVTRLPAKRVYVRELKRGSEERKIAGSLVEFITCVTSRVERMVERLNWTGSDKSRNEEMRNGKLRNGEIGNGEMRK